MKHILKKILRRRPSFEALSYGQVKAERHVFIFGIWGRTATTALQRLMNSSGELCIWGEPGEYLIDNLMDAYVHVRARLDDPLTDRRIRALPTAFRTQQHSTGIANALCDWEPVRRGIEQSVVDLLQPVIPIKRLGFKEIRIRSLRTLDGLRLMFPNCQFVYMFRDPCSQWPSVQTRTSWPESGSIELFIERVEKMAEYYLQRDGVFVEDQDLRNPEHLDRLCEHFGIAGYDQALVNDGVFAAKDKPKIHLDESQLLQERLGSLLEQLRSKVAKQFAS